MPDITVVNDLDEAIHVAFFIIVPTHWKNHLQPGERWTTYLPTLPLHFQVCWVKRKNSNGAVRQSRPFSPEESGEMGAAIGFACAAGTASVVTALTSFVGLSLISGPLMMAANAGGNRYALMGQEAKLYETKVWVPWTEQVYSVRMVGANRRGLWNVGENKQV